MSTKRESTTVEAVVSEQRDRAAIGQELKERRVALGLDYGDVAERAGVDRSRVPKVEAGDPTVRESTIGAIERALSELEQEFQMDRPSVVGVDRPRVIRFKVEGVYGAKAIIVEAEPEDRAALEAAVDRIMRNLRAGNEGDQPHPTG